MVTVFIAGHGRMDDPNSQLTGTLTVPAGVELYFAVPQRLNGTAPLSAALLSGVCDRWVECVGSGGTYHEHYLCPDFEAILIEKGKRFLEGNWSSDYHLLQTKGNVWLRLSDMLKALAAKFSGQGGLRVAWTCCRSPLQSKSEGKVEYDTSDGKVWAHYQLAAQNTMPVGDGGSTQGAAQPSLRSSTGSVSSAREINGGLLGFVTIAGTSDATAGQGAFGKAGRTRTSRRRAGALRCVSP